MIDERKLQDCRRWHYHEGGIHEDVIREMMATIEVLLEVARAAEEYKQIYLPKWDKRDGVTGRFVFALAALPSKSDGGGR